MIFVFLKRGNIIYHIISNGSDTQITECIGPETLTFKEILEILLKAGADPFFKDKDGDSAFSLAKKFNDKKLLDLIHRYNKKRKLAE